MSGHPGRDDVGVGTPLDDDDDDLQPGSRVLLLEVPPDARGARLDVWLAATAGVSRSQLGLRLLAGDVLLDGRAPNKAGYPLRGGERVRLTLPPPPPTTALPEALPVEVLYEDEHLIVLNKAADMVVHPSPGHDSGTLVNALVHRFGTLAPDLGTEDGRPRPGIVHRLDLGTSGAIVVARTAAARDGLMRAIAAREVSRRYLAVVHGTRLPASGTWRTLHGRDPRHRHRFSSRVSEGREAVTHWEVLARSRAATLIACRLETGRTHQIRMHCADASAPIVGDALYGGERPVTGPEAPALRAIHRQALHALTLAFRHPVSGAPITCHAPPPEDLARLLAALFGESDAVSAWARDGLSRI